MSFFAELLKTGNLFMVTTGLFAGILLVLILYMPKSAKVRLTAKFKKTGVLVTLCSEDGFERDEFMQADLDAGVFYKGEETIIFTPNPEFAEETTKDNITEDHMQLTSDKKKNIDEAMLKRTFTDTGKPHYIGLMSKGIAVSPDLLALIHGVNSDANDDKIGQVKLIEPQVLKTYFKGTFNAATLRNIKFAAEQRGFLRRPVQDFLGKNKVPIIIILGIGVIAYLLMTGKMDIFTNALDLGSK